MPITKLKKESDIRDKVEKPNFLQQFPDYTVLTFNPLTRRKQINFCRKGCDALRKHIGKKADWAEQRGALAFKCYFYDARAKLDPLGILAVYFDATGGKGQLLWWEP